MRPEVDSPAAGQAPRPPISSAGGDQPRPTIESAAGGACPRPKPATCRHCGSPLLTAAARTSGFCCAGCAYVHRLVADGGFDQYYRLRDRAIAPADRALFQPRDYAWLAALQREAERSAAGVADPGHRTAGSRVPELVLDLQGISCVGCVWLIERLFEREPGSLRIELNAQLGRLRLRWAAGRFDAVHFARTLQSFSYFVGPPGAEPAAAPESRDLGKRIGLCAAFALNVMLFTLPGYFGMTAAFPYARLFGTLTLVFGTLSFLAGGTWFVGRALGALRDRVLHIDLPIALGIVGAYAGSVYGWFTGDARFVYFDFVASFILLMLVGRWAQVVAVERNRRRLLLRQPAPPRVRVYAAAGDHAEVALEALQTGQIFGVPVGHTVPVDGRLLDAAAEFTTAWINGEPEPRGFRAGQRVPAGAVNVTRGERRLEALQPWSESLLAKLLHTEARPGYRHRLFERVIRGYLGGILGLSLGAGVVWAVATGDAPRALAVAIAVLVVSCPCGLGLALPLADETATVAARRRGVFVRENDLWARLGRVRKLIFDKTGTLTLEVPALANPGALAAVGAEDRRALLALVRDNLHPVSRCLHEELLATGEVGEPPAGAVGEEVGWGVSLQTAAGCWTLGRPGWRPPAPLETGGVTPEAAPPAGPENDVAAQSDRAETPAPGAGVAGCHLMDDKPGEATETEFRRDGAVLARFRFVETVRPDAAVEVDALRAAGLEVYLLSGDRQAKVAALAADLGLPADHAVGEAPPEAKGGWVRRIDRRDTLMLGDGANDSLAFETAFCRGTPVVHRGVLEQKADFYYLGHGIGGLRRLFAIDRARARTQRWILAFAFAYNAAAVGFAAAGLVNPLVAAVLMPASSLASLAIVGLGMRGSLRG
jgi:P-type Cu2+ transporter